MKFIQIGHSHFLIILFSSLFGMLFYGCFNKKNEADSTQPVSSGSEYTCNDPNLTKDDNIPDSWIGKFEKINLSAVGDQDVVFAKYDPDGNLIWAKLLGSTAEDDGEGIAVDSNGNIYITGYTKGNLNSYTNEGDHDVFIAKYDSDGNQIWLKTMGTNVTERGFWVSQGSNGKIYLSGTASVYLEDSWAETGGRRDLFISQFETNGDLNWVGVFGSLEDEWYYYESLAVDADGNSYLTGKADESIDDQPYLGVGDLFLTKYNSSGNKQWTRQLGTTGLDCGMAVTTDNTGNAYVAGQLNNISVSGGYGNGDAMIAKYDSNGNHQWTKYPKGQSTTTTTLINHITFDAMTNSLQYILSYQSDYFFGSYDLTLDQFSEITTEMETSGQSNTRDIDENWLASRSEHFANNPSCPYYYGVLTQKFSPNGELVWERALIVGEGYTQGNGITTDSDGYIYIIGKVIDAGFN